MIFHSSLIQNATQTLKPHFPPPKTIGDRRKLSLLAVEPPHQEEHFNRSCRNVPFYGRAKVRLTSALSKGGKMRGVATNIYLWKTSEKPKETGQNENSKFGSCIYV